MSEQGNNFELKVAQGVRETVNQDGAVLLDIEQGLCFGLNPVGTRIWEMLKDGRSVDEISDALEQEFHVPRAQILSDISDFLEQLAKMRLVGNQSPPAGKRGFLSRLFTRNQSA